jgi:hypothetical protein
MPESGTASEILVEIWHLYATGAIEQARQRLIGCWMFYMDGLSTSQDGRVALKLFSRLGFTTDAADVWASLPDPLIVYRAGTDGVAWTVDRDVASYLAREHALGSVRSRTVAKAGVLAYINGRGEAEVILEPTGAKT